MRIGILTGGGDCAGLNAVLRAVARRSIRQHDAELLGFLEGWRGPVEDLHMPLTVEATDGLIHRGGTILRTSRTNPFKVERGPERILETVRRHRLDALIAVGGEDTCGVASRMFREHGLNVVCIPKTIDNDLNATDLTFGFDTAVSVVADALDRLRTTAASHRRVHVCEVMGRHAGWIACYGGIAGAADYILVPEQPVAFDHLLESVKRRHAKGGDTIVVVAEGARLDGADPAASGERDAFGHERLSGVGEAIARAIEQATGIETRAVVLGHLQRGGSPTAFDRVLATRFGIVAADLVAARKFGRMVALSGSRIVDVPIEAAVGTLKTLDMGLYELAASFFE